MSFEEAHSVDLGPVGYFRIVSVRGGDPTVLVAEPAERHKWAYDLLIRKDGTEQLREHQGQVSFVAQRFRPDPMYVDSTYVVDDCHSWWSMQTGRSSDGAASRAGCHSRGSLG